MRKRILRVFAGHWGKEGKAAGIRPPCPIEAMNDQNNNLDDIRIRALLNEARPQAELPPRFRENVWRRIDHGKAHAPSITWLEALASLLLQPRFAIPSIAMLLLMGTLIGSLNGQAEARLIAQERYVATVVMPAH
jgi:hypothetical protein